MSESEWLSLFADNLAGILYETRTTQGELAEAIGVDKSTISRYLRKERMPSIRSLINIASFFGESLDNLMDFGEDID